MQALRDVVFMNLSLMFSACARMSPFNFHESQSHVFQPVHAAPWRFKILEESLSSRCLPAFH